jgi:Dihydrouridine synthase (Dus)
MTTVETFQRSIIKNNNIGSSPHRNNNMRRKRTTIKRTMAAIATATLASTGGGGRRGLLLPTCKAFSTLRHVPCRTKSHRPSSRPLFSTLSSSPEYTRDISEHTSPPPAPPLILPCLPNQPIIRSVMAPMVAASDYPFRKLVLECSGSDDGAGDLLLYTQMLHAKNFVTDANFRKWHCDFYECGRQEIPLLLLPSQQECLGKKALDGAPPSKQPSWAPLMVQLAGHDVDTVVQAALMVYEQTNGKIAGIDLVSDEKELLLLVFLLLLTRLNLHFCCTFIHHLELRMSPEYCQKGKLWSLSHGTRFRTCV